MPEKSKPTIRSIAEKTGFSKATVANALNGTPTVAKGTAEQVLKTAAELGYQRNPMVGNLMSAVRRSGQGGLQGILAVVEIGEPDRPEHGAFHQALLKGCRQCAAELGFGLEYFRLDPGEMTPERFNGIARARGIRGMIILPSWKLPELDRFDWTWLTGVYADYLPEEPKLNSVCCDHYRTVLNALEQLYQIGYRRPGMIFERGREERIDMRMSAALRTFQELYPEVVPIQPVIMSEISRNKVLKWVEDENPDVCLSHQGSQVMNWLVSAGYDIPSDMGFFCLNLAKTKDELAGLNLRPTDIGSCAVEQLIAQVQRAAWGRNQRLTNTTIIGDFVCGPTIRNPA